MLVSLSIEVEESYGADTNDEDDLGGRTDMANDMTGNNTTC